MSGIDQARSTARFVSDEPVAATFSAGATGVAVTLRDVSVNGAQIEHSQPIRPAMQGRLTLGQLSAPAVVIWTRLTGPGRYQSGLRIEEKLEVVAAAIRDLLARGVVRKGEDTLRQREEARMQREQTRERLVGVKATPLPLFPEDVDRIRAARQVMQSNPQEATKWYNRARATATEEHVRIAGSGRVNREDVLAVWEYMERRVELHDVVRALEG